MNCQQSLTRIAVIEKQIAVLLNLQIDEQFFKIDLSSIETVLLKIYQILNKNCEHIKKQPQGGYQSIELVLQQQQQRNRNLIKKQLEYRQYQNNLIEQLTAQRNTIKELKLKITKLNDQLRDKCLQILSLKNQNKSLVKDSKISCNGNLKTRQTMKEAKTIKQETLYALYSSHKKKLDIVNNKSNQNFTVYKLDKFQEKANKTLKSHKRRNSEQVAKKSSSSKKKSLEKKI